MGPLSASSKTIIGEEKFEHERRVSSGLLRLPHPISAFPRAGAHMNIAQLGATESRESNAPRPERIGPSAYGSVETHRSSLVVSGPVSI